MFYESVANHVRDAHLAILGTTIVSVVNDNALIGQLCEFAVFPAD